jgi:uncharacterized protein
VIEYPIIDEIDINGWDLRKALRLYANSNPGIIEWIQSPITYRDDGVLRQRLIELLPEFYSCRSGGMHYLNMARNNYRQYLKNELVPIKKYFYILRPLLACDWIVRHHAAPPIEFDILVADARLDTQLLHEIATLLEKKKSSIEMALEPAIPAFNDYIARQLAHLDEQVAKRAEPARPTSGALEEIFRRYLRIS